VCVCVSVCAHVLIAAKLLTACAHAPPTDDVFSCHLVFDLIDGSRSYLWVVADQY